MHLHGLYDYCKPQESRDVPSPALGVVALLAQLPGVTGQGRAL